MAGNAGGGCGSSSREDGGQVSEERKGGVELVITYEKFFYAVSRDIISKSAVFLLYASHFVGWCIFMVIKFKLILKYYLFYRVDL